MASAQPLRVPITLNVGLLGFNGDGAWELELDAAELHGLLSKLQPTRTPRCGPDGAPTSTVHDIKYNIVRMQTGLPQLQQSLASAMRPMPCPSYPEYLPPFPGCEGQYLINTSDVEQHFERMHSSYFGGDGNAYTILIVNPNKSSMARKVHPAKSDPPEGFGYRYVMGAGHNNMATTQMWIARKRFFVLDLSAGPCTRGMWDAAEGGVSRSTLPAVSPALQGGKAAAAARSADPAAAASYALAHSNLLASLSTLVISAVRHVIVPDMRSCVLPEPTPRLVVPIVVLRNHKAFDPLTPGHAHSLDIGRIKEQVSQLLFDHRQTLTVLPSTHDLHQHPQISVALTRALRADTKYGSPMPGVVGFTTATPYIDTEGLVYDLRHSVDWLASGLLERSEATVGGGAAGTNPATWLHEGWSNSSSKRGGKRSRQPATVDEDAGATRVLPVFVFSLLGLHPSLMLDAKSLVHASDHSVVVLQTNNSRMPIPFYADGDGTLSISMTTPTPHVLAGLAMSLGALVAPFESFGRRDGGAVQRDFLWAVGSHPFGPFSVTSILPDVMVDAARRHVVLARLAAASDPIYDATVALEALAARYLPSSSSTSAGGGGGGGGGGGPEEEEGGGGDYYPMSSQQKRVYGEIARLRDHPAFDYAASMKHLEEEAGFVRHREGEERRETMARSGQPVAGELLRRLSAQKVALSSSLAARERRVLDKVVSLHTALETHAPLLTEAGAALAAGQLEKAHRDAEDLLAQATSMAARTLMEVRELEATLSCCTIEAARPRSYHVRSLGALALVGLAIWLLVLWLTRPSDRRGQRLRGFRPGAALWGGRKHVD